MIGRLTEHDKSFTARMRCHRGRADITYLKKPQGPMSPCFCQTSLHHLRMGCSEEQFFKACNNVTQSLSPQEAAWKFLKALGVFNPLFLPIPNAGAIKLQDCKVKHGMCIHTPCWNTISHGLMTNIVYHTITTHAKNVSSFSQILASSGSMPLKRTHLMNFRVAFQIL